MWAWQAFVFKKEKANTHAHDGGDRPLSQSNQSVAIQEAWIEA
jgi:hypothetical protein